jgi:hypothetical protein
MQKIYHLARTDYSGHYATAGYTGTFLKHSPCPKCKEKGFQRWERISPLIIEWEPGSDVISDFTWPGGLEELVVTQAVKDWVQKHRLTGLAFGSVEMVQDPKLTRPSPATSRTKKRIWLPYQGPTLWDLLVSSWSNLDLSESKRTLVYECNICHRQEFSLVADAPLVVNRKTWEGCDVFRIREIGKLVFVVEKVKRAIEEQQFTNVEAVERGYIPDV